MKNFILNRLCTFDQAKALCESGFLQDSAYEWIKMYNTQRDDIVPTCKVETSGIGKRIIERTAKENLPIKVEIYSAYDVSELSILLPPCFYSTIKTDIVEPIKCVEISRSGPSQYIVTRETIQATQAQAGADMLISLFEAGKINIEKSNLRLKQFQDIHDPDATRNKNENVTPISPNIMDAALISIVNNLFEK